MKTIEQAAQEFAEKATLNAGADRTKRENAFKAGVEWAQEWISVEDELPIVFDDVLVKCKNGKRIQCDVDYLMDNGKFRVRANVTHWRLIERV